MALNIFPRREKTPDAPTTTEAPLPEPAPEALAEAEAESTKRSTTRRGTRGGRGRSRSTAAATATAEPETETSTEDAEAEPKKAARRTRSSAAKDEKKPAARASRSRAKPADDAEAPAEEVPTAGDNGAARPGARIPLPVPADPTLVALARAVEHQARQIEKVVQLQEQLIKRGPGGAAPAHLARVGVFVDVANVELAAERARVRLDWGKILDILTRDRELIRAVAYAPVHDDPSVSLETQRFAEPFLDKGYKIVTKPLKRFADGTVKANVDIELALDVITMLDRLDVVCLVSGDGDFQRLVEVVQSRGIRVEVVGYGSSTAGALRHAADHYIDLQSRLKDVRR